MSAPKKLSRASLAVIVLTLLAMVGTVLYIRSSSVEELAAPPFAATRPLDEAADYSLQFTGIDGRTHSLEDYRGKTIVLNFWATWCAPCLREMPSLAWLAKNYANSPDVAVLCLSDEPVAVIKRGATVDGMSVPVFSYGSGSLPSVYGTQGVPRTFVISPQGRVVFLHMGPADWSDPAVVAFLDQLSRKK